MEFNDPMDFAERVNFCTVFALNEGQALGGREHSFATLALASAVPSMDARDVWQDQLQEDVCREVHQPHVSDPLLASSGEATCCS